MSWVEVSDKSTFDPTTGGTCVIVHKGRQSTLQCLPMESPFSKDFTWCNPVQSTLLYACNGQAPRRIILATATSSGKSHAAYLYMKRFNGIKTYVTPQKAIANEKYQELRNYYGPYKVEVRSGDYISEDRHRPPKDYLVCTYEYLALAARNGADWLKQIGCIVLDEVHTLYAGRMAVDEVLWFAIEKDIPFTCLSATIPGLTDLAKHTKAQLVVESNWRPVRLVRHYLPLVPANAKTVRKVQRNEEAAAALADTLYYVISHQAEGRHPNVLVFVPSKELGWKALSALGSAGYEIFNEETPFISTLTEGTAPKAAFHCADLSREERLRIEEAFRNKEVDILLATHTLAYGVNLPAEWVVVLVNNKVVYDEVNLFPSLVDCIQMEGRAGRLGWTDKGEVFYVLRYRGKNDSSFEKAKKVLEHRDFSQPPQIDNSQADFYVMVATQRGAPLEEVAKYSYVFQGKTNLPLLEKRKRFLKKYGFITGIEHSLEVSKKGKFCFTSGIPPGHFLEFQIRLEIINNLESKGLKEAKELYPLVVSALHQRQELERARPFRGMFQVNSSIEGLKWSVKEVNSFIGEQILKLAPRAKLNDVFDKFTFELTRITPLDLKSESPATLRAGLDDVFGYVTGIWFMMGAERPFGAYGWLKHHCYYLARTLCQLKKEGFLTWTYGDILRTLHSFAFGLPPSMALIGGIEGIGHVRGSIILHVFALNKVDFFPTPDMTVKDLKNHLMAATLSEGVSIKDVADFYAKVKNLRRTKRTKKAFDKESIDETVKKTCTDIETTLKRKANAFLINPKLLQWTLTFALDSKRSRKIRRQDPKDFLEENLKIFREIETL